MKSEKCAEKYADEIVGKHETVHCGCPGHNGHESDFSDMVVLSLSELPSLLDRPYEKITFEELDSLGAFFCQEGRDWLMVRGVEFVPATGMLAFLAAIRHQRKRSNGKVVKARQRQPAGGQPPPQRQVASL